MVIVILDYPQGHRIWSYVVFYIHYKGLTYKSNGKYEIVKSFIIFKMKGFPTNKSPGPDGFTEY